MSAQFERSNNPENRRELFQQELVVNRQMQNALTLRINAVKEHKEPRSATFFSQTYKDQIELDELKIREIELIRLIDEA